MFDRQSEKDRFRVAVFKLGRGDPYALAKILPIPPVSPQKRDESKSTRQESLLDDTGTDWSGVLNSWLDACEASAGVRLGMIRDIFYCPKFCAQRQSLHLKRSSMFFCTK